MVYYACGHPTSPKNEMNEVLWELWQKEIEHLELVDLVKLMASIRRELDDTREKAAELQRKWDFLRIESIPPKMEEEGLESARISGVGTLSLAADAWIGTKDQSALFQWLEANGHGDLITETVNASTLKAFMKECLRNGEEIPDEEVVKFTPYTYAKITGAKKNA